MREIKIRRAVPEDLNELRELYCNTVTHINSKDYDENQITAWLKPWRDANYVPGERGGAFAEKLTSQHFFIAMIDDVIAGFGSVDDTGYLDFMYVSKDHQRMGVAKRLLDEIEDISRETGVTELNSIVSKTARGFFEKHGFNVIRQDTVEIRGATFVDNIMVKKL